MKSLNDDVLYIGTLLFNWLTYKIKYNKIWINSDSKNKCAHRLRVLACRKTNKETKKLNSCPWNNCIYFTIIYAMLLWHQHKNLWGEKEWQAYAFSTCSTIPWPCNDPQYSEETHVSKVNPSTSSLHCDPSPLSNSFHHYISQELSPSCSHLTYLSHDPSISLPSTSPHPFPAAVLSPPKANLLSTTFIISPEPHSHSLINGALI